MKTIKERAKAIIFEHESDIATAFSRAFALVQEIANAPEPNPPVLSDERILEIAMSDDVSLIEYRGPAWSRITVHNSIGGVYAFARAIEQELMKGCV